VSDKEGETKNGDEMRGDSPAFVGNVTLIESFCFRSSEFLYLGSTELCCFGTKALRAAVLETLRAA
jgi:hypothetical protein